MQSEKTSMSDPVDAVVMQRAWLHRRGKSTWMFEPSQRYGELVHITRNGTVYAILAGHKHGKPFWVARLCDGAWCTVERELRARSIEFEDAGDYVFPSA
jgi:hypothetical protein